MLLSTGLSTAYFANAGAQSTGKYDYFLTTDELKTSRASQCAGDPQVWTNDTDELYQNPVYWGYGGEISKHDEYRDAYFAAKNNGAVIWQHIYEAGRDSVRAIYHPDGLILDWYEVSNLGYTSVSSQSGDPLYMTNFQMIRNLGVCNTQSWQSTRTEAVMSLFSGNDIKWYRSLGPNMDLNLPEDYDGPHIPSDSAISDHINVVYTVQDKTIQGTVMGLDGKGFIGDQWTKAEVKITDQADNELYKHVNNDDGVTFKYTFDDYGNYKMHVRVYTMPPMLPSDIKPIVIDPLVINGQTYTTGTGELECDDQGNCSGITDSNTSRVQRRLNEFEADMHGIEAIVYEPIKFIATLPAKVGNCTGLNLTLFNKNVSIPCGYHALQNSQPTLAATMAIMMNGIVALLLGYKLFGFIRGMQDPKDDRIEVVKL